MTLLLNVLAMVAVMPHRPTDQDPWRPRMFESRPSCGRRDFSLLAGRERHSEQNRFPNIGAAGSRSERWPARPWQWVRQRSAP